MDVSSDTANWPQFATAELIANGWLEIGDGYRAKNSEMGSEGLPFIRAGDVDGRVNTKGTDLLGKSALLNVSSKRSQPGDVVLTTKGTIGRMAFVEKDDTAFVYSPQLCYWRSLDKSKLHARWLYYALQGPEMRTQMSWSAAQTDMAPYISLGDQRSAFHITLPPIEEQRRIATILGTLDAKIELNYQVAATLEKIARALFRSWFVDFDPVYAKAKSRDPGLPDGIADLFPDNFGDENLPRGWILAEVGKMFDVVAGNTPSTKEPSYWDGPHNWATPKDMSALRLPVMTTTNRTLTDQGLLAASSGLVPPGSLLLSSRAPIGYLAFAKIPVAVNQGIAAIVTKQAPTTFAWAWCHEHMDEIKAASNGSTFQEISKGVLRKLPMLRPSDKILEAYGTISSKIFEKILDIELQIDRISELRGTILPKLLSSELRISGEIDAVAAA